MEWITDIVNLYLVLEPHRQELYKWINDNGYRIGEPKNIKLSCMVGVYKPNRLTPRDIEERIAVILTDDGNNNFEARKEELLFDFIQAIKDGICDYTKQCAALLLQLK